MQSCQISEKYSRQQRTHSSYGPRVRKTQFSLANLPPMSSLEARKSWAGWAKTGSYYIKKRKLFEERGLLVETLWWSYSFSHSYGWNSSEHSSITSPGSSAPLGEAGLEYLSNTIVSENKVNLVHYSNCGWNGCWDGADCVERCRHSKSRAHTRSLHGCLH